MQPLLTQLLNLDGLEDYRSGPNKIIIEIKEAVKDWAICPPSAIQKRVITFIKEAIFHLARDLSISNRQVFKNLIVVNSNVTL